MKCWISVVTISIVFFFSALAGAHTPILWVTEMGNGAILIEGGFSNDASAAGVVVLLVEAKTYEGSSEGREEYLHLLQQLTPLYDLHLEEAVFLADSYRGATGPLLYEGKLVLLKAKLDEEGSILLIKPARDYLIVMDAGVGHRLLRRGPGLKDAEIAYLSELISQESQED